MKVMRMRAVHVTFCVIFLIAVFATGTSDNPLMEENNLEYNCSKQELSVNISESVIQTIGENFLSSPLIICLFLQANQIQSIKKGAFDSLPALEYLNIAGNRLTNLISFGGHENLKTLILANQSSHYGGTFQISGKYPQLRYLDLSGNQIRSIDWTMKKNDDYQDSDMLVYDIFPKLQILDLSYNALESWFVSEVSLFNLTHLFLQSNHLRRVNIQKLKNLIVLIADNNNIDNLYRQCYGNYMCVSDMPKLKYFSISNNNLYRLERDVFDFMPELAALDLSSNKLTDNIYGVFHYLTSLEALKLDNNQLTNVSLFENLVQLSSLSLNNNNIKYIDSEDLMNTQNLRKLYLNHNKIKNIHKNAFVPLDLLEELHLANNDLNNFPAKWSDNLRSLRFLNLIGNNFMYLESLSLSDTLPLISIDLLNNPIISFTSKILRDLPENVTINLIHHQRNIALDTSV